MLLLSFIVTLTIVVILNVLALTRKRSIVTIGVGLTTGLGVLSLFVCLSGMLSIALLLVSVVAGACCQFGVRRLGFAAASFGTTAFVFLVMGLLCGAPEVARWQKVKDNYPLESMEDRLAYEMRPQRVRRYGANSADPQGLAKLEDSLDLDEKSKFREQRVLSLERLHAGAVRQFLAADGFGVGRRVTVVDPGFLDPHMVTSPDAWDELSDEPIPQPVGPSWSFEPLRLELRSADEPERETHLANVLHFVNLLDFGYVRDRQQVAGFRAHAFHKKPTAPKEWRIERLELVGILKHDEPVVYVTPNFPRMQEVGDHPTRPLDAFEKESLTALTEGKDLIVQEDAARLRMFGSIRAVKQCINCHSVERGELLGAFSYQMSR